MDIEINENKIKELFNLKVALQYLEREMKKYMREEKDEDIFDIPGLFLMSATALAGTIAFMSLKPEDGIFWYACTLAISAYEYIDRVIRERSGTGIRKRVARKIYSIYQESKN